VFWLVKNAIKQILIGLRARVMSLIAAVGKTCYFSEVGHGMLLQNVTALHVIMAQTLTGR
jgi:hypothetical protein